MSDQSLCLVSPPALPSIAAEMAINPALLYLASLGAGSRPTQLCSLRKIAALFGATLQTFSWHDLRPPAMLAIRAWLVDNHSPSNGRRYWTALRGVLLAARRAGLMGHAAYLEAMDLPGIRGARVAPGRAIEGGELSALFAACRTFPGAHSARNAVILALLYGAGLRRAELFALTRERVIGTAIRVVGKGDLEREVPIPAGARAAIDAWVALRGDDPGALLCHLSRRGRVMRPLRPLGYEALREIIRRLAVAAGVKHLRPHDFRRTYVGDLLDSGADLVTVAKLVGHKHVETTSKYDRRGARVRARAAELLHVPFELARATPGELEQRPGEDRGQDRDERDEKPQAAHPKALARPSATRRRPDPIVGPS